MFPNVKKALKFLKKERTQYSNTMQYIQKGFACLKSLLKESVMI